MGGRAGQAKTRAMASEEAGSEQGEMIGIVYPISEVDVIQALIPHGGRRSILRAGQGRECGECGIPGGGGGGGAHRAEARAAPGRKVSIKVVPARRRLGAWRFLGRCTNSLGISSKTQQPRLVHRRRPRGGGRRRRRVANPTGGAGLTGKKGCGKWRPRAVAHEGAPLAGCRGCSRGVARSVAHRPSDVHAVSAARKSTTHTQRYLYRAP